MPRADLLALTEDDLVALTNRGTVKRAQRELVENPDCKIEEKLAGDVKFAWPDGTVCEIPAGASLKEARCSSGSGGISRHLVRSVLAYQRSQSPKGGSAPPAAAWDPGSAFSDEALEQHFRKTDVARARQRFETGVLVELVRSPKPLARFLDEPCLLRFMVPGDLRYIHSDCSPQALGTFVPLAVWAFRQLPLEKESGLISIQTRPPPVPGDLLDELENLLTQWGENGLATVGDVWKQRLLRVEERCREEGLTWPAEIVAELAEEYDRYQQHDARFSLERTVDLVGELVIRMDAIRTGKSAIPQILVRGSGADRLSEIAAARYVGLGCGVKTSRKSTTLTAYLQDADTGSVAGLMRDFANAEGASQTEPRDFHTLAQTPIVRGVSLAAVGAGQLLMKAGKRTPSQRLVLPRQGVSVNPQNYAWEKVRPPLLCESFTELSALLAALPPPSLRARRLTEDLFVAAVDKVLEPHFNAAEQVVVATLVDSVGGQATLVHPYTSRSAAGTQSLLHWLSREDARVKFVSGHARPGTAGLIIYPLCAVFEHEQRRVAVQPWIDSPAATATGVPLTTGQAGAVQHPVPAALQMWQGAMSELWLIGTRRVTPQIIAAWQEAAQRLEAVGLVRLAEIAARLTAELSNRLSDPRYSGQSAAAQLLYASLLARLAEESG